MTGSGKNLCLALLLSGTLAGAAAGVAAPTPAAPSPPPAASSKQADEFFELKVRPLLAEKCYSCHADKVHLSDLRLDSREALLKGGRAGAAVVAGDPDHSPLIQAIRYDGKLKMPPAGKLKDEEIAALTEWVRAGVAWPAGAAKGPAPASALWALGEVRKPAVPPVKLRGWAKTPIDRFVLARLEKQGLKPSPYADRRTLIRRVTLDLIGLPPTLAETEQFVADRSPDAWEKVVDRLLASPHFGERMAQHWLDLARYADSDGYHDDTDRSMWPFRDYVINAFNRNKP
ncbi:MAG TPA: DUF1549 domain-containing protein, partial [Armatimonadota bacterium]|nr:DUF1549 domain-containing protein [Armatimonadota bacterium]